MNQNMIKYFFYSAIVLFFFESQRVYGQYQNQINRRPAQLNSGWRLPQPQNNPASHTISVKKRESDEPQSLNKAVSKNKFFKQGKIRTTDSYPVYEESEVFIKFKSTAADKIHSDRAGRTASISLDRLESMIDLAKIERLKKMSLNRKFNNVGRTYKAILKKGMPVEKAIEILKKSPDIEYVEKVPKYYTLQSPDDPLYADGSQYALNLIHAIEAFELSSGNNEVFVAIVDDAFLYDHPDLIDNVDVSKCYDVADGDADTRPPSSGTNKAGPFTFSHGTHVGGIAGAVTNNGLGVASVSNNKIKLFGIKATRDETDDTRDIESGYEGVVKAIENGADVINMSFGGAGDSDAWQDLINDAAADGVIFVAAAGNGNTTVKNYPAAYDNVISVANTDSEDRKNSTSNYGEWISIAAPGANILSTVVGEDGTSGSYGINSGTSMSSPMVAGLVGLLLSENNTLTYSQIVSILQSTSDNIDARNPGFEGNLGAGRINAYNAMLEVTGANMPPVAEFISSDPDIFVEQTVSFSAQSLGNGLTYSWNFEGGNPASATGENVVVTFNNAGTFNVKLTVSGSSGSDIATRTDYVKVVIPQDCAILSYPLEGNRSFYTYEDNETKENNGPVVGQNIYGSTSFANLYDYLPGNYVSGALFAIGLIESENPRNAIVSFKVWEESSIGSFPGRELASKDVSYDDLKLTGQNQSKTNRASYTEIFFDNPPAVPAEGRFYLGFEIYYEDGDTIGFYTNEDGEGNGNESFMLSEGAWQSFSEIEFDANIEMSPVLVGGAYLNINAFVSEGGACVGNSVAFNTDGILQNIIAYKWTFEGGIPATSTDPNPIVKYSQEGEYEAELILTIEGCEEARKKMTKAVKIIDCDLEPKADFFANRYVIEAGDSVQFLENAANATGFSWTFEGGEPATSALFNPFVKYSEPGVYKVGLEVSNPSGEVSSVVKEEYIQVFEQGYCNFSNVVSNVPSVSDPTLYYVDDAGYISGTGSGDLAKAEFFDIAEGEAYIDKLEIVFGVATTNDSKATVDVVIFDNKGIDNTDALGAPGEAIATKSLFISKIADDIAAGVPTEINFGQPVKVDGPFYAGILLKFDNETDSVAILSTTDDEVEDGTSWEFTGENEWYPTSRRWEAGESQDPLDISLYITAHVRTPNQELEDVCNPLSVENPEASDAVKVYPNPFSFTTTIEYELQAAADVKLEIFNSLGSRVDVLEDSFKGKGVHQVTLNAGSLPKGLYIYKLRIGDKKLKSGRIILN